MKEQWSPQELIDQWTLTHEEITLIKSISQTEYNLFRFTLLEQVRTVEKQTDKEKTSEELAVDPSTFFLSPVAYKPYHREPDMLLWKP